MSFQTILEAERMEKEQAQRELAGLRARRWRWPAPTTSGSAITAASFKRSSRTMEWSRARTSRRRRDPENPTLPEGVRPKGSGFRGYFNVAGKTYSRIMPTVDEASAWRRDTMDKALREQAARVANAGPQPDPDVSAEEMAAMEHAA